MLFVVYVCILSHNYVIVNTKMRYFQKNFLSYLIKQMFDYHMPDNPVFKIRTRVPDGKMRKNRMFSSGGGKN